MTAAWAKLETHVVDGAFPLHRCVGSTDHSGVFVTQSAQHAPADLALKLIPLDTKSAQAQLARWRAATRLSHPHLLRVFQVGVCQLDGTHYLYVLMEYADQTLAQVLRGRALDEQEVREMLAPMLDVLGYLHRSHLAQGSLQPSNVLVVGDQLKLASDRVRVIGYSDTSASAEGDVLELGATLYEALTRIRLPVLDGTGRVELTAALPDSFRDVVARCLSPEPRERPTVAALTDWLRGEPLATVPPAPMPIPMPATTPAPQPDKTVELPGRVEPEVAATPARTSRRAWPWVLGAFALLTLLWLAYRWVPTIEETEQSTGPGVETPSPASTAAPVRDEPPSVPVEPTPPPPPPPPPPPAASAGIATSEVLPAVSQSSLDTVRGTLRVTIRVSVNQAGAVSAAATDDPGPSRYFERRSLEAAKKWTFAPADTNEPRSMRIGFAFARSGVTASVRPVP